MSETAQPGDLNAQLIAMYPADYAQALSAQGVAEEYAEDYQKSLAASAVLRQHATELFQLAHGQALVADGAGIDASANPNFAARLAQAGATQREVREFAEGLYPELPADAAVRRYQRDVMRAAGTKIDEPREPLYERPY